MKKPLLTATLTVLGGVALAATTAKKVDFTREAGTVRPDLHSSGWAPLTF